MEIVSIVPTPLAAVFGLLIGSFLSVCVYRIPHGLNIASPTRSFCPTCEKQLKWYHNIPVLSWIILKGKCGYCNNKISIKYPLIEITTMVASVLSFSTFGATFVGAIVFVYISSLIVLSFIDFDFFILPDVITIPSIFISIVLSVINHFYHILPLPFSSTLYISFWGFMAGAGFLFGVAKFYEIVLKKEGLGFGDVKLLATTGILFGPACALYTIFVGSIIGLLSLIGRIFTKTPIHEHFPFGPSLALATVIYIFWGTDTLSWVLGF